MHSKPRRALAAPTLHTAMDTYSVGWVNKTGCSVAKTTYDELGTYVRYSAGSRIILFGWPADTARLDR